MPRNPLSTDIRGQLVFLGTGTSVGVPAIGCDCPVCTGGNPRNSRTRCGLAVGLPDGNLLVDTPTDLRQQLIRERIARIEAVLYTHEHADHIFGLDDLRLPALYRGQPIPLYCEPLVEARIRKSFDYAFENRTDLHHGAVPAVEFRTIGTDPFELLGMRITPVRLGHGPRYEVLGFRFGDVAYCTDTNRIPPESMARLAGLDVLILDALRIKPHATHFSLDEAIEVARQLGARQTYFTHLSHELDQEQTDAALPPGMALAYDGLRVPLV